MSPTDRNLLRLNDPLRSIIERCRGQETCYVTPEEYRVISNASCEPADGVEVDPDSYEQVSKLDQTISQVFAEHGWPPQEKPVALVVRGGLPKGFWNA